MREHGDGNGGGRGGRGWRGKGRGQEGCGGRCSKRCDERRRESGCDCKDAVDGERKACPGADRFSPERDGVERDTHRVAHSGVPSTPRACPNSPRFRDQFGRQLRRFGGNGVCVRQGHSRVGPPRAECRSGLTDEHNGRGRRIVRRRCVRGDRANPRRRHGGGRAAEQQRREKGGECRTRCAQSHGPVFGQSQGVSGRGTSGQGQSEERRGRRLSLGTVSRAVCGCGYSEGVS